MTVKDLMEVVEGFCKITITDNDGHDYEIEEAENLEAVCAYPGYNASLYVIVDKFTGMD